MLASRRVELFSFIVWPFFAQAEFIERSLPIGIADLDETA